MLLDVPHGVDLVDHLVAHHLVLVVAPLRIQAGGELQGLEGAKRGSGWKVIIQ